MGNCAYGISVRGTKEKPVRKNSDVKYLDPSSLEYLAVLGNNLKAFNDFINWPAYKNFQCTKIKSLSLAKPTLTQSIYTLKVECKGPYFEDKEKDKKIFYFPGEAHFIIERLEKDNKKQQYSTKVQYIPNEKLNTTLTR